MARVFIAKLEADPEFPDKIVTMDESWISHYLPETKQQSKEWSKKGKIGQEMEIAPILS